MKYLFLLVFVMTSCADLDLSTHQATCSGIVNNTYNEGDRLQEIIARYAKLGIPGIAVAVRKGNYSWEGAAGLASIEQHTPLQSCHLMYSQSLAKTYTAVTIMQLTEKGKLDLDQSIRHYLPESIWKRIEYSDVITIRMLLNHTSGMFDYAYDYGYVTYLLNNGDKVFSKEFALEFILDKKPAFYPGKKYSYCNSGYTILAFIAEHVTGQNHATIIREQILTPLNLTKTFYREEIKNVVETGLVNSYFDRFGDGKLENVSQSQLNNILSMMGDDSIVAAPGDYVTFLDGLLNGKLVSANSLEQMKQWVNNSKGKPVYGLGLNYHTQQGVDGYGHAGGGLGAGCALFHYPEKDVTLFLGVNMCTLIEGPATDQIEKMREEIINVVFE